MKKLLSFLYSTRLMSIAILLFAVAMAMATFIENDFGTATSKAAIYNTKWFEILLLILTINFIGNIFRYRLYRKEKWAVFLFHIAFILTLFGALVTRYTGFEGMMHIREGSDASAILSNKTYMHIRVDNDSVMQNYSDEVLFANKPSDMNMFYNLLIPDNNYERKGNFNPNGEHKAFSVKLLEYIPNIKETLVKDESGDLYLHLVESSTGKRNDIYIKSGDIISLRNVLFAFNKPTEGAINISSKDGINTFSSPFEGDYMEMRTQKHFDIAKDSIMPLQLLKLHSMANLRFVFKAIEKGKFTKETASKQEMAKYTEDYLKLLISVNDSEKTLEVRGASNMLSPSKTVTVDGLNFSIMYGSKEIPIPFKVHLRDFELKRYAGSMSPASFASEVTIIDADKSFDYRIYMNHVLDYKGYRFFQSSWDKSDEKGTVLSVNHDYWGTFITYIAYLLMGIGMFFSLFWKGTRFSKLVEKLNKITKKRALTTLLLLFSLAGFSQEDISKYTVDKAHADKFGRLVIQDFKGRMKPVNTYALDILRKVYKKDTYEGLTAEQVLLSAQVFPEFWGKTGIVKVKMPYALGSELSKKLNIKDKHMTMLDFFSHKGNYILKERVDDSYQKKKSLRTASDKAVMNLDEQANVWLSVLEGSQMNLYPVAGDPREKWYNGKDTLTFDMQDGVPIKIDQVNRVYLEFLRSAVKTKDYTNADLLLKKITAHQKEAGKAVMLSKNKIDLEIKYNRWNIFKKLLFYYFSIGFLFLLLAFVDLFKPNTKWINKGLTVFVGLTILGLVFHAIGLGLRWYISGHAPWSNGYEAVVFVAFVTIVAGVIFGSNRSRFIIAAAVLFASLLLGIAHGNAMTPEVTNLQPVLKSYWLMIHVAVITGSYGFLGLSSLLAFVNLSIYIVRKPATKKQFDITIDELTYISEMTMTAGLYMLSVGTFLGGVWASESWGRYWGWDSKEVWSLISMMIYIFVLHMRLVPGLQGKFTFNLVSLFAIGTLIMTFFGVNYYLSGLHSYAAGDPIPIPVWVVPTIIGFVLFAALAYLRYKKVEKK